MKSELYNAKATQQTWAHNIEYIAPIDLKAYKNNARTHSKIQINQIAASIEEFGFINPILIDEDGYVIAGHGRIEAAKQIGAQEVPTIRFSHMSKAQLAAYRIADNRLAELAGWDTQILAIEFAKLDELDLDFELDVTGFELAEIDLLIDSEHEQAHNEDDIYEASSGSAVTQVGDLWLIGNHRLYCGDAKVNDSYNAVLDGKQAQMVFTDPPYNVKINGHVSGLGKNKHREFAEAAGEMCEAAFTDFLVQCCKQMAKHSADGSLHYICMDWRHLRELLYAGEACYSEYKNLIVWNKTNGGMGSLYRSKHELIALFKNGKAKHVNNVQLGQYGRYRTNVWEYAGANSFGNSRDDELAMHPTVKPVALITDAIRDASHRGQVILDPFGGSGSTMLAAERVKRHCCMIELDPLYCDTIIGRMQDRFGLNAILEATGESFTDVDASKANQNRETK